MSPVAMPQDTESTVRALVGLASDESPFIQFMDDEGKKATWTQR